MVASCGMICSLAVTCVALVASASGSETVKNEQELFRTAAIWMVVGFVILVALLIHRCNTPSKKKVSLKDAADKENPRVFLDITIDGESAGRIEMELFSKICPRTAENFRCLCTGEKGNNSLGKPLHFKGSSFYNITRKLWCQGGEGTGNESIYGGKFADEWENGFVAHSCPMLLSMAGMSPDTNGSHFFITLARTPQLDNAQVVFGQVVDGESVVRKMEEAGTKRGSATKNVPLKPVVIVDCGELKTKRT